MSKHLGGSVQQTVRESRKLEFIQWCYSCNIQVLGQSVECPLNYNAQILVQTAQCRFLCLSHPLVTHLLPPSTVPYLRPFLRLLSVPAILHRQLDGIPRFLPNLSGPFNDNVVLLTIQKNGIHKITSILQEIQRIPSSVQDSRQCGRALLPNKVTTPSTNNSTASIWWKNDTLNL